MSADLSLKLSEYSQKLNEGFVDGEAMSKRTKKRIMQKLGKLKKQITQESDIVSVKQSQTTENETDNKRKYDDVDSGDEVGEVTASKQPKLNESSLSKKELKVKLRILNKELAEFAQKKQLKLAKKKILWATNKGYKLDVHTFTNLINVHVRCNDMVGAAAVLDVEMKSRGIVPNLITYTTLMKGYCETGQLDKSSEIFFHAMKNGVKTNPNKNNNNNHTNVNLTPNVRSLNTFLRGCSRVGAVASASKAYSYFKSLPSTSSSAAVAVAQDSDDEDGEDDGQSGSHADASTFEYLVGILARAADITAAEGVVTDFITSSATGGKSSGNKAAGGADVIENAAIYLCLAKAYALCGSLSHAKKWLLLANSAVKVTQNATLKENMRKRFQGDAAPKESAASKSVALFLNHRRAEIQNELQLLEDYILCVESAATATAPTSSEEFRASACILNLRYLSQVLYFGFDGQCDPDVASDTHNDENHLLTALREKFGLDRISPQNGVIYDRVSTSSNSDKIASTFAAEKNRLVEKVTRAVDVKTGHINFEELFPQFITEADWNEEAHKAELSLPLKLEICSGNGEWVAAQAAADRGAFANAASQSEVKALWLALELRCDRVHNTLCQHAFSSNDLAKAQLSGVDASNRNNLAVIGGDASKILPCRFPEARLSAIFVNHPQPPEQRANEKDKKKGGGGGGAHLLTVDFFAQMHRTLSADGTITIVTDNQFYVKLLADSLVEMAQKARKQSGDGVAFVSRPLEGDVTRNLQDSLSIIPSSAPESGKKSTSPSGPSIDIWRGEPGQDAGHIAPAASSYFDRMWDLGQKKRRYFLFLAKM